MSVDLDAPARPDDEADAPRDLRRPGPLSRVRSYALGRPYATVIAAAVAARLVFAVTSFVVTPSALIGDEIQYVELARWLVSGKSAESWQPGYGYSLYGNTRAFLQPLVWLFWLFWPSRIFGQLLAVAFGVLTVLVAAWLVDRLAGRRWVLPAGVVAALWPSQVLFSSVALRESMIWFGYALAAAGVVVVAERRWRRSLLLGAAAWFVGLALIAGTRDQTLLAVAWSIPPAVVVAARGRRVLVTSCALVVIWIVPIWAGIGPFGWRLVEDTLPGLGQRRTFLSLEAETAFTATTILPTTTVATLPSPVDGVPRTTTTTTIRRPGGGPAGPPVATTAPTPEPTTTTTTTTPIGVPVAGADGQTYIQGYHGEIYVVDDTVRGSLSALPRGFVAVVARPFPFEASTSSTMGLAKLENVLWYVLYALALAGVVAAWRRRLLSALFLVGSSSAIVVSAALAQGNVGTAFRHRGQVLWVLVVLGAIGTDALLAWRSDRAARPHRHRRWSIRRSRHQPADAPG